MKKTKDQKIALVKEMGEALHGAASTVFVGFTKLTVADETAMRRALRASNVKYTVVKKTLLRRMLSALGHDGENASLEGEVAVAYGGGDDPTVAARLVHEFGTKLKDKLSILGGIFEGKLQDGGMMRQIATIPSMQVLRGMFAQIINSPRQRFAVVLSKVAEKTN